MSKLKELNKFVTDHPWMSFFIICGVVSVFEAIYATGCTCECVCC